MFIIYAHFSRYLRQDNIRRANMEKISEDCSPRKLALFDFDGTITSRDSMFSLLRFAVGEPAFYAKLFRCSPSLIAFRLGLLNNQAAKEKLLTGFVGGMEVKLFNGLCNDFANNRLPDLLRPQAVSELEQLRKNGYDIVVVTASAENWVSPWCNSLGIACIGTRLEVKEGRITGLIAGKNCNGEEKAARIRENIRLEDYSEILAFGDSPGDYPMFKLATVSYFKPFR